MASVDILKAIGAGAFGAMIGWFVYYINRYRAGEVSWADLTTVIATIGGGAVLALFPANTTLFAGYGIGLFTGFFAYFGFLNLFVSKSENFDIDWFLDGRRKVLKDGYTINKDGTSGGRAFLPSKPPGESENNGLSGPHPAEAQHSHPMDIPPIADEMAQPGGEVPHICSAPEPLAEDHVSGQRAALYNPLYWGKNADISIGFMGGSQKLRERVRDAAMLWIDEGGAKVTFRFWMDDDPSDANVRISFTPGIGSWSYIGKQAMKISKNKPTMNFGWLDNSSSDEELRRVVLHEFGHMLGLIHEHQHPEAKINWDKPKVYDYYMKGPNGWTKDKVDTNLFAKYSPNNLFRSEFDEDSIMMYAVDSRMTKDGYSTEWNSNLSDLDKKLIAAAYN